MVERKRCCLLGLSKQINCTVWTPHILQLLSNYSNCTPAGVLYCGCLGTRCGVRIHTISWLFIIQSPLPCTQDGEWIHLGIFTYTGNHHPIFIVIVILNGSIFCHICSYMWLDEHVYQLSHHFYHRTNNSFRILQGGSCKTKL